MMSNRGVLTRLNGMLETMQGEYPVGRLPEAVADLRVILQEIMNFDYDKPINKESLRIRFFNRDIGKDIFLGNCANSCTSLGSNASAAFQFILDQGTMYAVIETDKGDVKGYARFFLAIGKNGLPLVFIDSIDGTMAWQYILKIKEHIYNLAETIGLSKEQVFDWEDKVVLEKLGGALLEGYFHHAANVKINVSRKKDSAQITNNSSAGKKGGFDFTFDKSLTVQNNGQGIKCNISARGGSAFGGDSAQLRELQNATGFVPVIVDIRPMFNIRSFLGIDN